jgi:hypothetical protein
MTEIFIYFCIIFACCTAYEYATHTDLYKNFSLFADNVGGVCNLIKGRTDGQKAVARY